MTDGVYLYVICHRVAGCDVGPCKVGISQDPEKRLLGLQGGNPRTLKLAYTVWCPERWIALTFESGIHSRHADLRLCGEWFDIEPRQAARAAAAFVRATLRDEGLSAEVAEGYIAPAERIYVEPIGD